MLRPLTIGLAGAALLALSGSPAMGGPLQDCCSAKNAFCILPYAGGASGCTADGGTFFAANVCTQKTRECATAYQLTAVGPVVIQPPAGPPENINVSGGTDVIDTEMIGLDLRGVRPTLDPVRIRLQPGTSSPGAFTPSVDSFFDVMFEIDLPAGLTRYRSLAPIHLLAAPVGPTFPVLGVPYVSAAPVALVDHTGTPAGMLLSMSLVLGPLPDADGDGVADGDDTCPATPPAVRVNHVGCSDAQLCGPDADGDGKVDAMDDCPGTAPAAAIDDSGCSLAQFCAAQEAITATGKNVCRKLDWQNDEPRQRGSDSDCVLARGGPGVADDLCVPRP